MKTQDWRGLPVAGLGAVLDCYGDSHVGSKRSKNEDAYLIDPALGLFIVCDGVGGRVHGEVASATTVELIHQWIQHKLPTLHHLTGADHPTALLNMLVQALTRASKTVNGMGQDDPELRGMSTTAAILLLHRDIAALAHVGDSRIYLLRDQRAEQLTEDHTLGRIAQQQGILSAESAARLRTITEAVGLREELEADHKCMQVLPADRFLLCTDGLHQHFTSPTQIAELMAAPLDKVVPQAIALALECGGTDDITALIVESRS